MSDSPRVSVVVTARNDDHGGDLLRRMQIFVDGFLEQARRHGLNGELIVVEWNPPPDRPRLADALRWPEEAGPCRVRIIEVPAGIHRRYRYADRLGLFQMIAKNVGIRRAWGRFVLSTNVDLLFSDELVQFLVTGALHENAMYRIDRFDVSADVPLGSPVSEQLEFCRQHVLRICTRWGTFVPGEIVWLTLLKRAVKSSVVWGLRRMRLYPADPADALTPAPGVSARLRRLWWWVTRPLHLNACGDFTLLARERWFALRGHPELEMFSLHLDSVLSLMASRGGAREVVLGDGMRGYHIEHGSGWSSGEAESLAERITGQGVPILKGHQYDAWVEESRKRRGPIIFNAENWGLAAETLAETDPIEKKRKDRTAESVTEPVQA